MGWLRDMWPAVLWAVAGLVVMIFALAFAVAGEEHEREMRKTHRCVERSTTTIYVRSGDILTPITTSHCERWVPLTAEAE